jgi:transposase
MLGLAGDARIFLCLELVDMRKGFDGLSSIAERLFPETLLTGAYFVFFNKPRNKVKVLYWDIDGLVIWYKRLEKGTFSKKLMDKSKVDRRDFFMLLEGIIPQKFSRRFRVK